MILMMYMMYMILMILDTHDTHDTHDVHDTHDTVISSDIDQVSDGVTSVEIASLTQTPHIIQACL